MQVQYTKLVSNCCADFRRFFAAFVCARVPVQSREGSVVDESGAAASAEGSAPPSGRDDDNVASGSDALTLQLFAGACSLLLEFGAFPCYLEPSTTVDDSPDSAESSPASDGPNGQLLQQRRGDEQLWSPRSKNAVPGSHFSFEGLPSRHEGKKQQHRRKNKPAWLEALVLCATCARDYAILRCATDTLLDVVNITASLS